MAIDRTTKTPLATAISCDEANTLFARLADFDHVTLAVSGGPDSLALMALVADWRTRVASAPSIDVVTFDHGLRAESVAEVRLVAEYARACGLQHHGLRWQRSMQGDDSGTRSMAAARDARYQALGAHVRDHLSANEIQRRAAIVTAHHQDDVAETVLMRLARGSGVDGLAAIPHQRTLDEQDDVWLVRPLLSVPKARLLATVAAKGWQAVDDPSNLDPTYERPRWRLRAAAWAKLGVTPEALATTAQRAAAARDVMFYAEGMAARQVVVRWQPACEVVINRVGLTALPDLLRTKVLSRVIAALGGETATPALSEVERLAADITTLSFCGASLGGTVLSLAESGANADALIIRREWARIGGGVTIKPGETVIWDARFVVHWRDVGSMGGSERGSVGRLVARSAIARLSPGDPKDCQEGTIMALGQRPSEAASERLKKSWPGARQATLQALPVLWCGDQLMAFDVEGPDTTFSEHGLISVTPVIDPWLKSL